ncbi:hypothetical protein N1851_023181 [Merluccius polli]|uniref:Uncharacterized protein n=1 Tax=Merluccius polli TaxID=89951 RepID=A0AA47MGW7_MERPO|nr:hypothetical protein N1851_023181 [Merluccius polli]
MGMGKRTDLAMLEHNENIVKRKQATTNFDEFHISLKYIVSDPNSGCKNIQSPHHRVHQHTHPNCYGEMKEPEYYLQCTIIIIIIIITAPACAASQHCTDAQTFKGRCSNPI